MKIPSIAFGLNNMSVYRYVSSSHGGRYLSRGIILVKIFHFIMLLALDFAILCRKKHVFNSTLLILIFVLIFIAFQEAYGSPFKDQKITREFFYWILDLL